MGVVNLVPIGAQNQLSNMFSPGPGPSIVNAAIQGIQSPDQPLDASAPAAGATAPVSSGPTAAQIAAANKAASDQAAANAINAGFGQVLQNYDDQIGDIPNQIKSANDIVDSQYGSQKSSLDSSYGVGNSNLQYARGQVDTQTHRSIQDLARSIRQSMDSYSTMIGTGGGGDSSANDQLSYALQKAQAQGRTTLYNNAADQQGAITQQQSALDATHMDHQQQLDAWKAQQIMSIGQQFRAAQAQLEQAKAGANKDKLLALGSLNTNLVNQAVAALSGVEAQHQAATAAINAAIQGLSQDNSGLANTNYSVQAAPATPVPALAINGNSVSNGDSFSSAVPYFKKLQAA